MKTLTLVQTNQEKDTVEGWVLSVNELVKSVSGDHVDDVYGQLARLNLGRIAGIPLYKLLWPRFAIPSVYSIARTSITLQLVLYEELSDRIEGKEINTIKCRNIDSFYMGVVKDLADSEEITVESSSTNLGFTRIRGFLYGFIKLLLVITDGFVSSLYYRIIRQTPTCEVLFIPHLNRFGSLRPVIDAAEFTYQIVAPVASVEWIRARWTNRWDDVSSYDPLPIGQFGSPLAVFDALRKAATLMIAEGIFGKFKQQLVDAIEDEFGYHLNYSIGNSLGRTYRIHLSSLPNYFFAREMIRKTNCKGIVVGAQSLRQQSILLAAETEGIKSYHVPHTIPLHHEALPRTDTVHFVPSETSQEYLQKSEFIPEYGRIVPIGRPLLSELASRETSPVNKASELRIVVATQPFNDQIRREFVSDIINGLENRSGSTTLVIKPHPNENQGFYGEFQLDGSLSVDIIESDLNEQIRLADLTIVVTTNAGLESIALGTPCVSINRWEPWIFSRPYQEAESIPVLRSRSEAYDFFENLDREEINQLRTEQLDHFNDQYLGYGDVGAAIADYIRDDIYDNTVQ